MKEDQISIIGIDRENRLYVKPEREKFTLIYRSATEVHWDNDEHYLYAPANLKNWTLFEWYEHIIYTVKTETGCTLIVTDKTSFKNLPESLIQKIK